MSEASRESRRGFSLPEGQILGGCRVIEPLGHGGMAEVYLAEDIALERRVALKVLRRDLGSRNQVERFLKEARMCSRVEHPSVVAIHNVGEEHGLHYMVMQYVEGRTLAELVKAEGGPLEWPSAIRLIEPAADGLEAVHTHGLIHRDVKPSNIMLSADSRVILMDFGLVRGEDDVRLTLTGRIVGTPAYMSPEQCRGEQLDRRSDIYSLGSTLYYLLVGHPPFRGSVAEVVNRVADGAKPPLVRELSPDVPWEISHAVAKAMNPDPKQRFPSAAAMGRELKKITLAGLLRETTSWRAPSVKQDLRPAAPGLGESGRA